MQPFISELQIKRQYSTINEDDIVADFYDPVLALSTQYRRAAGFFSSNVLLSYITGLESLVNNNGKIFLIISPFVSETDARAFIEANSTNVKQATASLFESYRVNPKASIAAQLLVALITENILTIKFIIPRDERGIYHEKIGIFTDGMGLRIAINGSNNETDAAVSSNLESFNTFCEWKTGQDGYVTDTVDNFERLWNGDENTSQSYQTLSLDEAVSREIFDSFDSPDDIHTLFNRLKSENEDTATNASRISLPFTPFSYQEAAATKWMDEHRGIVSFATGTGKTKTAILCIKKYIDAHDESFIVICVPDKTLNNQWADEIRALNILTIQCYSDNNRWHSDLNESINSSKYLKENVAIIVTKDTMRSARFQQSIHRLKNRFLFIADECHHLGTYSALSNLPKTEYRLGLSATPFVYGNQEMTNKLQEYFGGIIAEYSLAKAIEDGRLTKYRYHPVRVSLTDGELTQYLKISHQVATFEAKKANRKLSDQERQQEEMLLFKRARIVYSASEKMVQLQQLLCDKSIMNHLLIYCGVTSASEMKVLNTESENLNQLQSVNQLLSNQHIIYAQYTKNEDGAERKNRISGFKDGIIDVMTAIRCLDEGVDIPQIRSAIIMASSGNPREFIQRRGRLLRLYPEKECVDIYDMVVLENQADSLNKGELKRVREFSNAAINRKEIEEIFDPLFSEYLEEKIDE
jgi:superfamily II DNA or RNA helicase